MKIIPPTTATCAAILALFTPLATAADDAWTMDYAAAKTTAAESEKDLFLEFTGSDWCPPCKRLNSEVFSKEKFLTEAKKHFVLVKLDFPNDDSHLTEAIKTQNEELSDRYGIKGYPTIVLTDAQGRPYASTGYREGGVESYLKHLEELRAVRDARDKALGTAADAEGVAKAKALLAALEVMDLDMEMMTQFYGDEIAQIKINDPDDETGFVKQIALEESLLEFQDQINELAQSGDFEGILPVIDKILETDGLKPDNKQEIILTRAMVYAQLGRFDKALKTVDEAEKASPDSEVAPQLDGFREQLTAARDNAAESGKTDEE